MRSYRSAGVLSERDRFWLRVVPGDACWVWVGRRNADGFGVVEVRSPRPRLVLAHELAFEYAFGPLEGDLTPVQLCENPACENPAHLDAREGRRTRAPLGAVLTHESALELRQLAARGWTVERLRERFGVSKGTVYNVVRGLHWTSRSAVRDGLEVDQAPRVDAHVFAPVESALERELRESREAARL